ncbi:hypothetical protein CEXT_482251 [Caerostris extrusa]|uniref:C2H2-type domain-containing protein n=1 Tax=Caerostris extrusa TaxID=172846 RepID=A0AAV4W3U3_CAEEX|nr:hypothetical protein CEXT_482251 [Caerostris extrusa]
MRRHAKVHMRKKTKKYGASGSDNNKKSSESFTSSSYDLDQFSSWSNFLSPFRTISDTPVVESPIQMDTLNTSSVMSSKIGDHLGSLVETTTNLAEASSEPVEPRNYSNKKKKKDQSATDFTPAPSMTVPKRFIRHSDLNRHLKIHSGQKPFQCRVKCSEIVLSIVPPDCSQQGSHREKPYSCDTCGRRFASNDAKMYHARKYT